MWVTDITYIRTWQGWLYLAVVMDLFSRKIVGWSAGPTIHRELVLDAVLMAVRRRHPRGTMIHSDQGTQYGCDAWRRFCRDNHLEPSMRVLEVGGWDLIGPCGVGNWELTRWQPKGPPPQPKGWCDHCDSLPA